MNNISKTTFWVATTLAATVALGLIFYSNNNFHRDYLRDSEGMKAIYVPRANRDLAWVEIDFGTKKRLFEGNLSGFSYPLEEVISAVAEAGTFDWRKQNGAITVIAGVKNNPGQWKIYKNGSPQKDGLEKLSITAGDRYSLKYEK